MPRGKYHEWLTEDGLTKLEGWARDGLIDEQIADNIGINAATLYRWKNKYPEIDKALEKGKEVVDYHVENALLKRALGYDYEETTIYPDGKISRTVKHQPGNTTAQIFWLKNRKPDEWRDKKEVDLDINEIPKINIVRGD